MRRFSTALFLVVPCLALLTFISACGGTKPQTTTAASITLNPSSLSLNEGQVLNLTAIAKSSSGAPVVVDITFSSSNTNVATVSPAGAVCGGKFDSNNVVCSANGDGQATITATSGTVSATSTVYVHKQVDRVVISPVSGCSSMGALLSPTATAYNISSPGCSLSAPCDITSTVGPFSYGSGDLSVASSATGINPNYDASTNSPTYQGGGKITGTSGQTCNLTDFSVGGGTGLNPTYSPSTDTPTYVSGGNITGTAGQTCTLSNFNGLTGASAVVTLTANNSIASGTHLAVATPGSGGTDTPPTTATFGNGTATCSGTATVKTSLLTITGVNPVIGATGTVALTGNNTIAAGTKLTITNQGFGAVYAPSTATLSNGTATCSGTAVVITSLNSVTGLSAQNPGATVLYASVSGVNSVGTPFTVCPVASINVHDSNSSNTNFTLTGGQTQGLVADVVDSAGQSIKPNLAWGSSQIGAVKISSSDATVATLIGVAPGTTTVTATCVTPICNINMPPVYPNNVVTASVAGTSATTVYAASTKSLTVVPINTNTNTLGTSFTLPALPNSIVVSQGKVYLGADSGGVMIVNTSANTITRLGISGKVLAVSPDEDFLVVSDSSTAQTFFYDLTSASLTSSANGTSSSGVFTPDSNWILALSGQKLVRQGYAVGVAPTNLGYTPNGIGILGQGSLLYITKSGGVDIRSTCDQSDLQTLSASNPSLVQGIPNGSGAVAVDPPNLDIITTPQPTGGCPVAASSSLSTYDLQAGNFTPTQLFLSYDSSRAWVISNLSSLLTFDLGTNTPTAITLANGAQGLSGGITLAGGQVYIGASDKMVHRINVPTLSDDQQFDVGLKDANSIAVVPDLVAVQPK